MLVKQEFFKVWKNRFFLLSLLSLLLVNLLLIILSPASLLQSGSSSGGAYRRLNNELQGMAPAEKIDWVEQCFEQTFAIVTIESVERAIAMGESVESARSIRAGYSEIYDRYFDIYVTGDYLRYTDNLYDEYRFIQQIYYEAGEVGGYSEYLESINKKAGELVAISIFNREDNANAVYNQRLIERTIADYASLDRLTLDFIPQKGLRTAINFQLTDLVALFIILSVASTLIREEIDTGLIFLLRSTKRGRLGIIVRKLIVLFASVFIISVLLYGSNLVLCSALYGLGNTGAPIQSLAFLLRSTLRLNILQYLILFVLSKWAGLFIVSIWVVFSCMLTKKALTGYALALALPIAAEVIRVAIPATSSVNLLRYANIASLLQTNEILGSYRLLRINSTPLPLITVEIIAAIVFIAVLLLCTCVRFCGYKVNSSLFIIRLPKVRLPRKQQASNPRRLLATEFYKLLVANGGAAILAFFIIAIVFTATNQRNNVTPDEIYYRNYIASVRGPYTEQTRITLQEEEHRFAHIYEAEAAMMAGEITPERFSVILESFGDFYTKASAFNRVISIAIGAAEDRGRFIVYDTGYNYLFGVTRYSTVFECLLTVFAIVMLNAPIFAYEKRSGMASLLPTTPLGRRTTTINKLIVSASLSALMGLFSLLPSFYVVVRDYGMESLSAPLRSIPAYENAPGGFPILFMVILSIIVRLVACELCMMVTIVASNKTGSTVGTAIGISLVLCLPLLFSFSGLEMAKWIGIYPLFDFPMLLASTDGAQFAWLFLAMCITFLLSFLAYLFSCTPEDFINT